MMPYAENSNKEKLVQTAAPGVNITRGWVKRRTITAANAIAASTTGVTAAVLDNGGAQEFWITPKPSQCTEKAAANQPTVAPTLAAVAGATALAAGVYQVAYCYRTANGLSQLSPAGSVTIAATNLIAVTALAAPPAAVLEVLFFMTAAGGTTYTFAGSNAAGAAINLTTTIAPGITQPGAARNTTATTTGTAANVIAVSPVVFGLSESATYHTETLPAFTAAALGTVVGLRAFKTILGWQLPHNGTGVSTSLGIGSALGIPDKLAHNTVLFAFLNNVKEVTAPTVAASTVSVSQNTVQLNSALNGTQVDIYYIAS